MTTSLILTRSRRPDITVRQGGRIDIAARIARALALHPGDVVGLCACSDSTLGLFVKVRASRRVGRHIGTVFPVSHGKECARGTFRCNSIAIATAIANAAKQQPSRLAPLRLPCGEPAINDNNVTIIPIITRNPL